MMNTNKKTRHYISSSIITLAFICPMIANAQIVTIDNNETVSVTKNDTDPWSYIDNALIVGDNSVGNLIIEEGAVVRSYEVYVGKNPGSQGSVYLSGPGATWEMFASEPFEITTIGHFGSGSVTINNGASLNAKSLIVGYQKGSTGTLDLDGTNSTLNSISILLGGVGDGSMSVRNGGEVNIVSIFQVGGGQVNQEGIQAKGLLKISESNINIGDILAVSANSHVFLTKGSTLKANRFVFDSRTGIYGGESGGSINVSGSNTTLTTTGRGSEIGSQVKATVLAENEGKIYSEATMIGNLFYSYGSLIVKDYGSLFHDAESITLGSIIANRPAKAEIIVYDDGEVSADTIKLTSASSMLYIGNPENEGRSGILNVNKIIGSNAGGAVNFVHNDYNYIFSPEIFGTSKLNHSGSGKSILISNNAYTGGTYISAGALQLGDGGITGSIVGDIVNNSRLILNRSNALSLGGVISGTGSLLQKGLGTTTLAGDNTYTGGTTIQDGALQLGDGGMTGSIVGDIINNSRLILNRSDALSLSGVISGTGSLLQKGVGTTTLAGDNTYMGGTTIQAGALQLGDGGTTGSIVGDVANSGRLIFDRSDTLNFNGAVSGSGAVEQKGSGVVVLGGTNTYKGGTTIQDGVLQVASNANLGDPYGALAFSGGTLRNTAAFRAERMTTLSGAGGASTPAPI